MAQHDHQRRDHHHLGTINLPTTGGTTVLTIAQQVSKRCEYRRLGIIKLQRPQRSTSASKLVPTRQQGGTNNFTIAHQLISAVIIAASASLQKLVPTPPPCTQRLMLKALYSTFNKQLAFKRDTKKVFTMAHQNSEHQRCDHRQFSFLFSSFKERL